jgi:ATP-binding cassette subfamily B protein
MGAHQEEKEKKDRRRFTGGPERFRAAWRLFRLFHFAYDTLIAPWPPFAVFLVVTAVLGTAIPLARLRLTADLLNALARHHPTVPVTGGAATLLPLLPLLQPYLPYLAALTAVMVINWLIYMDSYQRYVSAVITERVRERFEQRFLAKALSLRLEQMESAGTYNALERARLAVAFRAVTANDGVAYRLTMLQRAVTTTLGSVAILGAMATVHWTLPVVLLLGSFLLLRWRVRAGRELVKIQYGQTPLQRRRDYWRSLLLERGSAAEVRLFGLAPHILRSWRDLTDRAQREVSGARSRNLRRGVPVTLGTVGLQGLVVALLLVAVARGALTAGAFVAYLYALQEYLNHLHNNSSRLEVLQRFVRELGYADAFFALKGEEIREGRSAPPLSGAIRFEDVGFTYPGAAEPALAGITLHLQAGEHVALVGENGAGKSTLAKLLLGLYRPTEGRITVDGVDLRDIAPDAWRAQTGAVFQDYARYALSVRENIGFGRIEKMDDLSALAAAAQASAAEGLIAALPEGYEATLGKEFEAGQDLSGGQWQKLALARAYLRDAPLVVLDEPASALDALAEREVYRQFVHLSEGKTMLLITHRLGAARLAGRVVFLEQGRLAQEGTHDALMAAGGPYAELYVMQAEWYREVPGTEAPHGIKPHGIK